MMNSGGWEYLWLEGRMSNSQWLRKKFYPSYYQKISHRHLMFGFCHLAATLFGDFAVAQEIANIRHFTKPKPSPIAFFIRI